MTKVDEAINNTFLEVNGKYVRTFKLTVKQEDYDTIKQALEEKDKLIETLKKEIDRLEEEIDMYEELENIDYEFSTNEEY